MKKMFLLVIMAFVIAVTAKSQSDSLKKMQINLQNECLILDNSLDMLFACLSQKDTSNMTVSIDSLGTVMKNIHPKFGIQGNVVEIINNKKHIHKRVICCDNKIFILEKSSGRLSAVSMTDDFRIYKKTIICYFDTKDSGLNSDIYQNNKDVLNSLFMTKTFVDVAVMQLCK